MKLSYVESRKENGTPHGLVRELEEEVEDLRRRRGTSPLVDN